MYSIQKYESETIHYTKLKYESEYQISEPMHTLVPTHHTLNT